MLGLTIWDFIFAPFFIILFSYIAKRIRRRYADDPQLQFYFVWGFRIKMAMVLAYSILSGSVIAGDQIVLYFGEGKHFAELIKQDFNNISLLFTNGGSIIDNIADEKGYLMYESNYMVVKIAIILCFFTASKFMLMNIILGFIAFIGSWQLFLFFRTLYPHLQRFLAFAAMGIPTVVFWSSGINKETICMASLGFLTKSLFDLFTYRKKVLMHSVLIVLAVYFISTIKSYIIFSYLPFYLFFLLIYTINQAGNPIFRILLKLTIPVTFVLFIVYIYANGQDFLAQYSTEKVMESVASNQKAFENQAMVDSGSYFTLGEFDGTIGSFLSMAPLSIITTFFRPFLWECKNLIMLLTSLEGMALLFFTLRIIFINGLLNFFRGLFTNSVILYCMCFSLLFAIFIGTSTFNFGSLARYKIPCLPFFLSALIILQSYKASRKEARLNQEKSF